MTEGRTAPARWILIVSGFFAVLELVVSLALCVSPESVLETVDLGARGVQYVISMWAARQFALGVIFGFATIRKSIPMLTIAYIFFLVMFVGDFLIGVSQEDTALAISAVAMCVVSSAMLVALNKRS